MLVTVFVFIGIEGASVYSRFAKERKPTSASRRSRLHHRHPR